MDFQIVKLHYNDIYEGWRLKEPNKKSPIYDTGYFILVDGYYFKLGIPSVGDHYYVKDGK